jgi:hypothetical protein
VLVAFAADVLVAIAKSITAIVTGSASILAEAAHSWADTGNQAYEGSLPRIRPRSSAWSSQRRAWRPIS